MNGNSKRERVDSFIRRAVRQGIQEVAWNQGANGNPLPTLRSASHDLETMIAYNVADDPYRMKELADIMAWKKPPKERG